MKYVKLKGAIVAAEKEHGLHGMDYTSREILHTIASANLMEVKCRVSDVVKEGHFGTPPTVYARLDKLVEGGWIIKTKDKDDGRAVLLEITPMARAKFKKMSKALERH